MEDTFRRVAQQRKIDEYAPGDADSTYVLNQAIPIVVVVVNSPQLRIVP